MRVRKASLLPFVFMMYAYTTGGPFGLEDMVTTSGPGLTLLYHLVIPFFWCIPVSLAVAELITLGGWREFGAFRAPGRELRARAAAAAEAVGLEERLARPIGELSVGELQRALFARLILQDAAVILLDEPFAAVDAQSLAVLLDQLARWHREDRTVVAVLHDLDMVRRRFPATLVLARRCLAWGATDTALPALAA